MMIDYEVGKFFCFGCNVSGDAMKFVNLMEKKLDDLQSCIKYYKIINGKKSREIRGIKLHHKTKIEDSDARNEAHDYYYGLKTIDWTEDSEEFGNVKDYMMDRGFRPTTLNKAKAKYTYNVSYPIVFPMIDNGKFKGWVCRTNLKHVEEKRKYLYNTGFSRRNTLVGYYKGNEPVFVVEGYMDKLKLNQYGLKRVVAILGWKITAEQIEKLKAQGIVTVISALDSDECGRKGTQYLGKHFNVVPFQYQTGCKDPGELNKKLYKLSYKNTLTKLKEHKNEHTERH